MAALTNARHEKYAQGLASGMSQRAAYRAAFKSSERWKDSTVDKRASELLKNGEILGRYKELAEESASEAIMSITERKEWLSRLIENDDEETSDRLKALDTLNKMDGVYIKKMEISETPPNPMEGLTTEELKKLIDSG